MPRPKTNNAREIAAHFTQSYMEEQTDAPILQDFDAILEGRVHALHRSGNKKCFQDVGSLLYCIKDLKVSCRDAGNKLLEEKPSAAVEHLARAENRVQEIGQLVVEIKHNHPEEYERSCKGFIKEWKGMVFDKGKEVLEIVDGAVAETAAKPAQEKKTAAPGLQL